MADKCGFVSCLNVSDGESNFCATDRCSGITTSGMRCKSSTNCKVSHKSHVGQQLFTFVKLFTVVGIKTYNGVKNFFYSSIDEVQAEKFGNVVAATQALPKGERVKCWIAQFNGRAFAIVEGGVFKEISDTNFIIKKDQYTK